MPWLPWAASTVLNALCMLTRSVSKHPCRTGTPRAPISQSRAWSPSLSGWGPQPGRVPPQVVLLLTVDKLSVKGQTVNILGFVGHTVLAAPTGLCHGVWTYSQTTHVNEHGWVPIKLYLQKTGIGDFPGGPVAKTLLPKQGAWVRSLVSKLDPTFCN